LGWANHHHHHRKKKKKKKKKKPLKTIKNHSSLKKRSLVFIPFFENTKSL